MEIPRRPICQFAGGALLLLTTPAISQPAALPPKVEIPIAVDDPIYRQKNEFEWKLGNTAVWLKGNTCFLLFQKRSRGDREPGLRLVFAKEVKSFSTRPGIYVDGQEFFQDSYEKGKTRNLKIAFVNEAEKTVKLIRTVPVKPMYINDSVLFSFPQDIQDDFIFLSQDSDQVSFFIDGILINTVSLKNHRIAFSVLDACSSLIPPAG